jgi:deoxyribose-phosphate aldolase
MDSDDVVRRIAAEVLRRLGETSAAPAPAPAHAGPAASRPAGGHALVLLTGGDARLDEALLQVGRLAERCSALTVVLSTTAEKRIGQPAVRRAAPGARVLLGGEPDRLLDGVDAVYLPNLSLNAAAKIGRLIPDSLVCILAVRALLSGIPVVATRDTWLPAGLEPARVPAPVRAAIERLFAELAGLGVAVVDVDRLLDTPAAAAAPSPAPAPHAVQDASCDHATTGECSGCGHCVERKPQAVGALVSSGADRIGATMGAKPGSGDLGKLIDHTLLKPDATETDVRKLCEEARKFVFASVCINPSWVGLCARLLEGSPVKVCTVIGFPLGATTPTAKSIETRDAIANGANEIDMVINVGALKSGDDALVRRDIESVVQAARGCAIVKVILETALLTREEKIKACLLAKQAGADFVKTSTGFSSGGATVEDIALMRETVGPGMGVKASGGIRDTATAAAMVAAGATRIGASASVAIVTGQKTGGKGY